MKRIITKPRPLSWIFCLLLIPFGLFFSESSRYVATFSNLGLGGGIGGLIGLAWQQHRYNKLSLQQKREVELAVRDERNVLIGIKAGDFTWQVLSWALLAAAVVVYPFHKIVALVCYSVVVCGILVNLVAAAWLRKRM